MIVPVRKETTTFKSYYLSNNLPKQYYLLSYEIVIILVQSYCRIINNSCNGHLIWQNNFIKNITSNKKDKKTHISDQKITLASTHNTQTANPTIIHPVPHKL